MKYIGILIQQKNRFILERLSFLPKLITFTYSKWYRYINPFLAPRSCYMTVFRRKERNDTFSQLYTMFGLFWDLPLFMAPSLTFLAIWSLFLQVDGCISMLKIRVWRLNTLKKRRFWYKSHSLVWVYPYGLIKIKTNWRILRSVENSFLLPTLRWSVFDIECITANKCQYLNKKMFKRHIT